MNYINLFESYTTQKELELLSTDILFQINLMTHKYKDQSTFVPIELQDITDKSKYKELSGFINDFGNLHIQICDESYFEPIGAKKSNGVYIVENDKNHKNKYIFLKETPYVFDEFFNSNRHKESTYSLLLSKYNNTLVHELQHAFDDYRSLGKYKTSNIPKLKDELINKDYAQMKEDEIDFVSDWYRKNYFNAKSEVDAFFTDAISNIKFYELDLDKSFELNKEVYVMRPFEKVKKDFISVYKGGYKILTDEHKQRILRKLGQFYEIEKEYIKQLN